MAYSNCLFEAIKAKLRDTKHVHVFRVPKRFGGRATHFMWYNDKSGTYYHSVDLPGEYEKLTTFWAKLRSTVWHEQKVKEIDEAVFNAFILQNLNVYNYTVAEVKRVARKMHLRILNINSKYTTSNTYYEPVIPDSADVDFLRKVFRKEPAFKVVKFYNRYEREMAIMTYDELVHCTVDEKIYVEWKFIGIDDEEFTWLYAPACKYAKADELNYGAENQSMVQTDAQ